MCIYMQGEAWQGLAQAGTCPQKFGCEAAGLRVQNARAAALATGAAPNLPLSMRLGAAGDKLPGSRLARLLGLAAMDVRRGSWCWWAVSSLKAACSHQAQAAMERTALHCDAGREHTLLSALILWSDQIPIMLPELHGWTTMRPS